MKSVIIRSAQPTDAAAIAALHVASWRDAYASILDTDYLDKAIEAERLRHWVEVISSSSIIEVAEDVSNQLVGFVCALPDVDPERGSMIDNLHVSPALRGQNIGERLLRRAASRLVRAASRPDVHLWVFELNERAIRFYSRLGGELTDRDVSPIPAAGGKPIVCISWPDVARLSAET